MIEKLLATLLVLTVACSRVLSSGLETYDPAMYGYEATVTETPISPDGTVILNDLPRSLHMRNCGGSDGAGLCVFTSINMAAYYQGEDTLYDFQKFMKSHPGGGYPEKVDRMITAMCSQKGCKKPAYLQIESNDLAPLKLACKSGRALSVTYAYSPAKRYGGSRIAHMVSVFHIDDKWTCVIDNNFPGTYEWFPTSQFPPVYAGGGSSGWCVVLLRPGPPPVPVN